MRQLFLVLLLLQVSSAFAGEAKPNKKPKGNFAQRVHVGVSVTPGFNYRWLRVNEPVLKSSELSSEEVHGLVPMRNQLEAPYVGVSAGARVTVDATKFLAIESGVDYACYMYRNKMFTFDPLQGSDSVLKGISGINGYNYLNIPVAANFTFGKKKLQGIVSAGCNINVLLSTYAVWTIYKTDGTKTSHKADGTDPFVRVNVSPFIGIGMQYTINPLLQLRIMPMAYMQALKNIHTPLTEHLYGAGLNVALFFAVKKKA